MPEYYVFFCILRNALPTHRRAEGLSVRPKGLDARVIEAQILKYNKISHSDKIKLATILPIFFGGLGDLQNLM